MWYGTYREDVVTPAGTERRQRKVRLGTLLELPTKNAATNKLAVEMGIAPTTDVTFQQLTDRWEAAIGSTYKASSLKHYTGALGAYVLPTFKDTRIATITQERIQNFLAEQAKRYSKSVLHTMRIVFKLTLGWAADNNLIKKNPCIKIKLPIDACEERCVKRHVLTPMQITALVSILPEPYATLVLFIAATGLRISEAVAVKPSDFHGDVIRISRRIYKREAGDVKSKKSARELPVSGELKQRMLQIAGSEWIFSFAGRPLDASDNGLRKHIRPACEKLGIELGGWHDFRHTLTTKMRKAGVHPRVIADVLGHSRVNLQMETYDRSDATDIAAALLPNSGLVTLGHIYKQQNPQNQPNSLFSGSQPTSGR